MMIALVMLMFCSTISASVNPIDGENLWRLVARIGLALDPIQSDVCELLSKVDEIDSDVDALVVDFISVADFLTSQADAIDKSIESLLEPLETDLLSVSDVLTSELEIIDNDIAIMQDFLGSKLDENSSLLEVLISEVEEINQDLLSTEETILSAIEALEDCLVDIPIYQSDFVAGTFTISQPGVYQLCEDITMTFANPAINIVTSNVLIDLNGHTMTVNTFGINVSGQQNIQIKNGLIITNLGTAIVIGTNTQNVIIEDIQTFQGGISVTNSQGITIVRYRGMGFASSISLLSNSADIIVQDSSVIGSVATGSPLNGFVINNASNVICDNCQALSSLVGFLITNNAFGVVLRDCYTTAANGGFYCTALSSSGFIMERCNAEGSQFAFFVDSNVTGGEFVECVAASDVIGFELKGNKLLLKRCVAANNVIGIDIAATASNIQILDTCSVNNTTNIANLGTNTTVINLGTVEDILLSAIETISGCICSITENIQSTLDVVNDQAMSIADHIFSGSDSLTACLVGIPITNVDLPLIIGASGVYTVCEPLTHNGSTAITVAANNVVINLNGYTLTTDSTGIVSSSGHSNVHIKNGTIQPGLEAIIVQSSSQNITLSDLTVYQPGDVGIHINTSSGVVIEHCVIDGNNGTSTGNLNPGAIYLSSSGSVLVKDCIVSGIIAGTPFRGICIIEAGTGGVELQNCSVSNTVSEAFRISSGSANLDNVLLKNCSATESGDGFLITHTAGTGFGPIVDSCISEGGTGRGFVIDSTSGTTLINCCAARNGNRGFLFTSSTAQTVALLCISQNNLIGFEIDGIQASLRWCTASNNATIGFNIGSIASNAVIDGCLASGNGGSGVVDASPSANYVVDTRSQDPANPPLNPAYNLNGAPDSKASATVIRIS